MKYIYILDFASGIPYKREIPIHLEEAQIEDIMEYFEDELGIRESDTQYMVTSENLDTI